MVLIFALWGLLQLLLGLVHLVVLLRYQALIPFMYILILIEYAMRLAPGQLKPIETTGAARVQWVI